METLFLQYHNVICQDLFSNKDKEPDFEKKRTTSSSENEIILRLAEAVNVCHSIETYLWNPLEMPIDNLFFL